MDLEMFKKEELGAVRVIQDEKGEPWFVLSDVCKILDIKNVSDVKNSLDIDDIDTIEVIDNIGRKQKANAVCDILGYVNSRDAIKDNVDVEDIIKLKEILKSSQELLSI